jgi:hypothetical protein
VPRLTAKSKPLPPKSTYSGYLVHYVVVFGESNSISECAAETEPRAVGLRRS